MIAVCYAHDDRPRIEAVTTEDRLHYYYGVFGKVSAWLGCDGLDVRSIATAQWELDMPG